MKGVVLGTLTMLISAWILLLFIVTLVITISDAQRNKTCNAGFARIEKVIMIPTVACYLSEKVE